MKNVFKIKHCFIIFIISIFISLSSVCKAQTQKRIYIANDDHTDYIWNDGEEANNQALVNMLDYYLALADSTENEPPEYQSRWNCDGTFWVWLYKQNRSDAQFQKLINRIKDGHISIPLNQLVVCLGGAPMEAVLRGFYYAGELERQYGITVDMGVAMENQTLPYGLSSLWAGSGAKYSWKGICNCNTQVTDAWDREHEIYWLGGPDGSKILMKWNSLLNDNTLIGGYAEAYDPAATIEYINTSSEFNKRYPYNVIGAFGKGHDGLQNLTDEFPKVAKAETNSNRKIIVSNMNDFFEDFNSTYGSNLPTAAASYGNEWDLYCASMAEESAIVKRAVEKLRGAEALATLVSLAEPGFMTSRQNQAETTWRDLGLYWEHNWGANGNISKDVRAAWQRKLANEIKSYADALASDAASELGALIEKSSDGLRFYAFNPLGWSRTDIADISYADTNHVYVIDLSSGNEVPSQIIFENGNRILRILAEDVPAVGYKVYEIKKGQGSNFSDAAAITGNEMESDYYKIFVENRGAISKLKSKKNNSKEYSGYVEGREINDLGPGTGTLSIENVGPVSVTLKAVSSEPLQHTTRITLIRNVDRIDIQNEITQNFGNIQTWGFSFSLDSPDLWHEEVGAIIRAKYLDEGGHYSRRNARYDWMTLNHFADMSDPSGMGVTLSNADCYFMKFGNSHILYIDESLPKISVLAGGQVDGPNYGIKNQGGDSYFLQRFALRTHDNYNATSAMRFSLEHQNPLITSYVAGGNFYPETSFSFLNIDDSNVVLWSLKPAEDGIGKGIIARVWNLNNQKTTFNLELNHGNINKAQRTTHIETPLNEISHSGNSITETSQPNQIQTYLLDYAISPLPVELSSFSAKIIENKVFLYWETTTEVNNYGFDVERAQDNNNKIWSKIGFVAGHGTSNLQHSYKFIDESIKDADKFIYRIKQIDTDGKYKYSQEIKIDLIPASFELKQNYPNPFNPSTKIQFSIPKKGHVKLTLYNIVGEKVTQIIDKVLSSGNHEVELNLKKLSSGVYFYRLEFESLVSVKKLILIK